MKRCIAVFISLSIALLAVSCKKQEVQKSESLFTIYSMLGDVTITNEAGQKKAVNGDKLKEGDVVETGEMSLADISYGSAGIVRIQENSRFSINVLQQKADADNVRLTVEKGSLYSIVPKLTKGSTYEVKSDTCVASVRGTAFKVSSEEKKGRIDVLSGTVSVKPVKQGKVVEDVEEQVNEGAAVELEEKDVEVIVEKKEKIKVKDIEPEQLETIAKDIETLKAPEKPVVAEEAVQEEKAAEKAQEIEEVKDIAKELEKISKTIEKKKEEVKEEKQKEIEEAVQKQAELEKKRRARQKAAARLKAQKEAEEKARIEEEKKKLEEKKRRGVQNVPTL